MHSVRNTSVSFFTISDNAKENHWTFLSHFAKNGGNTKTGMKWPLQTSRISYGFLSASTVFHEILLTFHKPATDNSWDSCKHVSWLFCEKKMLHENYLHTLRSSYYFLIKYFFTEKSLWFHNFSTSSAKWFEAQDTRNQSREVTTATWTNLYKNFISCTFSCCERVSQTSR